MITAFAPYVLVLASTPPSEAAIRRDATVDLEPPPKKKGLYKPPGSPQRWEIEIKFGPYVPDVDRNYSGVGFGPYATIFGETNDNGVTIDEPKWRVMPVLAAEWQFAYVAGRFGLGLQVGFFRAKANAPYEDAAPTDESVRSSADEVRFGMVPLALQLVYRFEMPADRWGIPIVPYAKFGPVYAFWWSRDGSGSLSRNSEGEPGHGGTWGWQVNAGGMLRLDAIEPRLARSVDKATGINHTYLFGEYQLSQINNFEVGDAMSLGDGTWFAGLAIEF